MYPHQEFCSLNNNQPGWVQCSVNAQEIGPNPREPQTVEYIDETSHAETCQLRAGTTGVALPFEV